VLLASTNALTALDPAQLARWPLLRRLDASENRISALCTLPPMPRLEELSLSDNAVSRLEPQRASWLPLLRRLDLSFNGLADAPEAAAWLAALPGLGVVQLHDNPLVQSPGYADALPRLLPWLTELDRRQLGGEGAAPVPPRPEGDGWRGCRDASAASRAHAAVGGSAALAIALERRLRTGPGLWMGSNPAQRRATVQHWLPALRAAVDCGRAGSTAAAWDRDTGACLAVQQAVEAAALATLRPKFASAPGPTGGAGAQHGEASRVEGGSPGHHLAAPPAWLVDWAAAQGGFPVDDCGWPQLAAACADALSAVRAPEVSAQQATQQRLDAQARYEARVSGLAAHHLQQLLEPPAKHQEMLVAPESYTRRLAALQAAAAAEAAATALQAALRGRAARDAFEEGRRTAAEAAALVLQAAWRGRVVRCSRLLAAFKSAASQRRRRAAVTVQAVARGWLARRRLATALAVAARAGSSPAGCTPLSEEGSLGAVQDDFLALPGAVEFGQLFLDSGASSSPDLQAPPADCAAAPAGGRAAAVADRDRGAGAGAPFADRKPPPVASQSAAVASGESSGGHWQGRGEGSGSGGAGEDSNANSEGGGDEGVEEDQRAGPAAARAAWLEARLRTLMDEWGFRDLATAKAYYK
jgi:hypothetical protein